MICVLSNSKDIAPVVTWKWWVDRSGDILVYANDIWIGYFDCTNGVYTSVPVDTSEVTELKSFGFTLDTDNCVNKL